jgi:glycine/sarcosine N-methyltransferase
MRALERHVPGAFDVVLAADNALPHLMTSDNLRQALRAMAAKLRPGGLFLATIRDYDGLGRPATWPARILETPAGERRMVQQVWEWLDERCYRVHIHITREVEDGWRCDHHVGLYRALSRRELNAAPLSEIRWMMPADTGFHQPIVVARKLKVGPSAATSEGRRRSSSGPSARQGPAVWPAPERLGSVLEPQPCCF